MKLSLNWLKQYVDISIPTDDLIKLIGSRLVEVEEVVDLSKKYQGIKIVEVKTAERIEGSDHLHKCIISDGSSEHQVVCGAPNVHAGMLAVWLSPGTVLPASFNEEPLVLDQRKIMSVESAGMLAGADELGFSPEHKSIAEIDPVIARSGDDFAEIFDLNDVIIEVENKSLTHRPDCFGIIGFAREIAGILGQKFTEPDLFSGHSGSLPEPNHGSSLTVTITDPVLCPRYSAAILDNFSDKSSKYLSRMAVLLAKSGMRPISPIVDATNYFMLLTGQPLHAFDYDKLISVGGKDTPEILVRTAKKDEKITLLDSKTIECDENDILITSNNVPVALAGAMGAANTAIDEMTKRIVLESATFSLYNLRRTQMRHGIFSEAITRFTKGQPSALTTPVLDMCVKILTTEHGIDLVAVVDEYPSEIKNKSIKTSAEATNSLLGSGFSYSDIEKTLHNVGFEISCDCGKSDKCACEYIKVTAPWWRTDIHIQEDIIEEVGRLNGYDTLPLSFPTRPLKALKVDEIGELKSTIREALALSVRANEMLTYSFVPSVLLEKAGQDPVDSYKIINSISPDLEYFRQSLTPSILEKVYVNLKAGYSDFALFEINQVSQKPDGLTSEGTPVMKNKIALVLHTSSKQTSYYLARAIVEDLLKHLGIKAKFLPAKPLSPVAAPFELKMKRSAEIQDEATGTTLGIVGEYKRSVLGNMKLPASLAGFEFGLENILKLTSSDVKVPKESSYPSVDRDLTFRVAADLPYADLENLVRKSLTDQNLQFTLSPVSIYQGKDQSVKNISFTLTFASYDKTLSSDDIAAIIDNITTKAKSDLSAEII